MMFKNKIKYNNKKVFTIIFLMMYLKCNIVWYKNENNKK